MPRLFAAVALDERVRDRIATEQQRLLRDMRGASLRWVQPEHMHLTLVFIGEVSGESVDGIVHAMKREILQPPFDIEFAGVGVFPERGAPRALWIGVDRGRDELVALQRTVAGRLEGVGIAPEERPFSPHLTLGRWRGRGGRPSEKPREQGRSRSIAKAEVRTVTLFLSRPTSAGPSYSVLAEATLVEGAAALH
jgi:RNA 2',3'-cyclic 3'-phosphodiesterase